MRAVLVAALCGVGCYHQAGVATCSVACASNDDCPSGTACGNDLVCHDDGQTDCSQCFGGAGSLLAKLCISDYGPDLVLDSSSYNTDDPTSCARVISQPLGPDLCVVTGDHIIVGSVNATGTRPLVLVARDMLTIEFFLVVASRAVSANSGAGASFAGCAGTDGAPLPSGGTGGGAGGSFSGQGGSGGMGASSDGGAGPLAGPTPTFIRGGCDGGSGGITTIVTPNHGVSGGAVYLAAGQQISIDGTINASGSGGPPSDPHRGGGGGGSGGLIVVDAPLIVATSGLLMSSGGGGAGGGGTLSGSAGSDPVVITPTTPAKGGMGNGNAGMGGSGSTTGAGGAGNPGSTVGGGGGGGGGAGYIITTTPITGTAVVVPAAIVP